MLPFRTAQFLALFASYNAAILQAQVLAHAFGAVALVIALRGGAPAGRIVAAALAAMWLWTGAAYHLLHFTAINPAAWLFGAAFLVQGAAFLTATATDAAAVAAMRMAVRTLHAGGSTSPAAAVQAPRAAPNARWSRAAASSPRLALALP